MLGAENIQSSTSVYIIVVLFCWNDKLKILPINIQRLFQWVLPTARVTVIEA